MRFLPLPSLPPQKQDPFRRFRLSQGGYFFSPQFRFKEDEIMKYEAEKNLCCPHATGTECLNSSSCAPAALLSSISSIASSALLCHTCNGPLHHVKRAPLQPPHSGASARSSCVLTASQDNTEVYC